MCGLSESDLRPVNLLKEFLMVQSCSLDRTSKFFLGGEIIYFIAVICSHWVKCVTVFCSFFLFWCTAHIVTYLHTVYLLPQCASDIIKL